MMRMIARAFGAVGMLALVSGAAPAQPSGSGWTCSSWRETAATQSAPAGRECAQWSKGQAPRAGQVPPPPFAAPAAKSGDAKAAPAGTAPQKAQKRKKKQRRRG